MKNISKLTAITMSLPFKYEKGFMEIDVPKAEQALKDAYESGVRNFTSAPQYLMGKSEEFVGNTLKDVRKEITLSTVFPYFDPTLPKENPLLYSLERSLKAFQTDYIDCLYLYGDCLAEEHLKDAKKAKEMGKARHIGIVFKPYNLHTAKEVLGKTAPIIDTIMAYFVPTIPNQLEMYAELKKNGLRIVAAGLLDVGSDSLPSNMLDTTEGMGDISATEVAARYFLKQDFFDEIIFVLKDKEHLDLLQKCENTIDKYSTLQLQSFFQNVEFLPDHPQIICSGCGYCTPCPKGINITKLFNIYAYYTYYGMLDSAIYAFYNYQNQLGDRIENLCVSCGMCEKKCLHRVPIMSKIRELEQFMDRVSVKTAL